MMALPTIVLLLHVIVAHYCTGRTDFASAMRSVYTTWWLVL
jgi:hypothetical protein